MLTFTFLFSKVDEYASRKVDEFASCIIRMYKTEAVEIFPIFVLTCTFAKLPLTLLPFKWFKIKLMTVNMSHFLQTESSRKYLQKFLISNYIFAFLIFLEILITKTWLWWLDSLNRKTSLWQLDSLIPKTWLWKLDSFIRKFEKHDF